MNTSLNKKIKRQLQDFVHRIKSRSPNTEVAIHINQLGESDNLDVDLTLQVVNPLYQFDISANGKDIDKVLDALEDSYKLEVGQRKSLAFMMAEGIGLDSPIYSKYLH